MSKCGHIEKGIRREKEDFDNNLWNILITMMKSIRSIISMYGINENSFSICDYF